MKKINLNNLPKDTQKITVFTINNVYTFKTTKDLKAFMAKGGKYIKTERKVLVTGSTWGGSAIMADYISYNMHLEIILENGHVITTSAIKNVEIEGKTWKYNMDWGK